MLLGLSPPPIYEGGSAPCNPLRRSSPFPTLSLPKSRDRVGPLMRTSLRSIHRTTGGTRASRYAARRVQAMGVAELVGAARDATPVAWLLAGPARAAAGASEPPEELAQRPVAAAGKRIFRRRCPQAHPAPPKMLWAGSGWGAIRYANGSGRFRLEPLTQVIIYQLVTAHAAAGKNKKMQ
jgi:hypothetical protein